MRPLHQLLLFVDDSKPTDAQEDIVYNLVFDCNIAATPILPK
jgi:hypothetical protein